MCAYASRGEGETDRPERRAAGDDAVIGAVREDIRQTLRTAWVDPAFAWRTSLVVCPLRNRTRSAPTTRNFVVEERSPKRVAIFVSDGSRS